MDKNNEVRCTVENCYFNHNRACEAGSIEIDSKGDGMAETSDGTSCSTFRNHDERD